MLKGTMRKGLYGRLMSQGGVSNPMMARAIAEAVYPSSQSDDMMKKPIVGPKAAAGIVEGFLDQRTYTFEQMMTMLWGPGVSPLDL